jgi:hypothetical protein
VYFHVNLVLRRDWLERLCTPTTLRPRCEAELE